MSTTGPISNYYVDSLISHEIEDVQLASRLSVPELLPSGSRPTTLVPECSDFSSCSFAPKSTVFTSSWRPVHSQSSVVYHPYTHQPQIGTDSRYVRSWLEPISGTVSFPSYPVNTRHFGLKTDNLTDRRADDCFASSARGYPDYFYNSPVVIRDKTQQNIPSPELDVSAPTKHKDDKPELDPSKWQPSQFIGLYRFACDVHP